MLAGILWTVALASIVQYCHSSERAIQPDFDDHNNDKSVLDCLNKIIHANFVFMPTVLISESDEVTANERSVTFYRKIINLVFKYNIPRIIDEDINAKSMYGRTLKGHVLSIKYFFDCDKLLDKPFKTINQDVRYLIIIFNSSEACNTTLHRISCKISKYEITFLKLTNNNNYDVLTYIPQINITDCKMEYDVSCTVISSCASVDNQIVFPNKEPQNMMACPFKVGMASTFPFAKINQEDTMQLMDPLKEEDIKGCDIEIMKIMSKYFNFTLELYYLFKSEEKSENRVNFLKFLLNGTLDACAGGLFRIYGDVVEYSGVYGRQAFVWMYPVRRGNPSWQNLMSKVKGAFIFFVFYFCYCITWYMLCIFDKQPLPVANILLYSWGTLIGTSTFYKAKTYKHRIINFFYLIMCLHLTAYVNIQMYSHLTIIDPPTTYKTNEGIYKSNLDPFLDPIAKYFLIDKQYESFANSSKDCVYFTDCAIKSLEQNGVTLVVDGSFIAFQAERVVNDEATVLKVPENMLTVYHEMAIRKNVSITRRFQKIMTRLGEAGISERLYHEALGILVEAKAESATKNIMSYSYSCGVGCSITLAGSAGAFFLWLIGCAVSLTIFIVEITVRRENRHGKRGI